LDLNQNNVSQWSDKSIRGKWASTTKIKLASRPSWQSGHYTENYQHRPTRTPPKNGGERRCSGRISSSWFTGDTRRVTIVTNTVMRNEWGKDEIAITTNGHLWHRYSVTVMMATVQRLEWWTSTRPPGTIGTPDLNFLF
jgi:hypothetical protein